MQGREENETYCTPRHRKWAKRRERQRDIQRKPHQISSSSKWGDGNPRELSCTGSQVCLRDYINAASCTRSENILYFRKNLRYKKEQTFLTQKHTSLIKRYYKKIYWKRIIKSVKYWSFCLCSEFTSVEPVWTGVMFSAKCCLRVAHHLP